MKLAPRLIRGETRVEAGNSPESTEAKNVKMNAGKSLNFPVFCYIIFVNTFRRRTHGILFRRTIKNI